MRSFMNCSNINERAMYNTSDEHEIRNYEQHEGEGVFPTSDGTLELGLERYLNYFN